MAPVYALLITFVIVFVGGWIINPSSDVVQREDTRSSEAPEKSPTAPVGSASRAPENPPSDDDDSDSGEPTGHSTATTTPSAPQEHSSTPPPKPDGKVR